MSTADQKRQDEALDERPAVPPQKRPYRKPELRRLGSVVELTLGGGNSAGDGRGTQKVGT
jgi:hypothetical protein